MSRGLPPAARPGPVAPSPARLVLLGTGTPNADPQRAGPAAAVVVGDTPYLVDFGPGVVRQAAAARRQGIEGLAVDRLATAFLTHLHSDHTAGYPDLILTPWVLGRQEPLRVFGPPGLRAMTGHVLAAYEADIRERLEGLEPANPTGWQVVVQEVEPGWTYRDDRVQVQALPARHGSWPALSFRFVVGGVTAVISGDTAPHDAMPANYAGCDLLLHEVYSEARWRTRPADWQAYHRAVHTSTRELAAIARQARPGLLVLTHQLFWGATDEDLVAEIQAEYDGKVVSGRDLDVFPVAWNVAGRDISRDA